MDLIICHSNVLTRLADLLENNFELPASYKEMSESYFKYLESNNYERTYQAIIESI